MKIPEEKDKIRAGFYSSIDKSENDLEKKITYISAGALALSITFIEKIIHMTYAEYFYLLIIGWILLSLTLAINLISIFISRKLTMKSLKDFDNEVEETVLINNIAKRNNLISNMDLISLINLLIGIFFVVIFCSINLNNQKTNSDMRNKNQPNEGRFIPSPSSSGGTVESTKKKKKKDKNKTSKNSTSDKK